MDPAVLLALAGLAGAVYVFFSARRAHAPGALAVAAALDTLCGMESLLLVGAHLIAVVGRALSGKGVEGAATFVYNFRFYSLVFVGVVIVIAGFYCLIAARGLTRADPLARRRALRASLVILAVNAPLAPIQGFAYGLAGFAFLNLIGLAVSRKWFRGAAG